jgi:DNA-binding CsgD family transcriptional regulator/PAS domain-containing protein
MHGARLDHLIGLVYDAAAAPELWPTALEAVGDALGGCALVMSILSPREGIKFAATVRIDPDYRALIEQRFASPQTNPLVAAMPRLPVTVPIARAAILPDREYLGGALYNEVFRPQRLAHAAAACLLRTPDHTVPLGIVRQAGSERPDRRDLDLLERLLPHMQRAVQLHLRLASLQARSSAAEEALDHLPCGVVLVDACGKVLFLNRAAQSVIAAADGLTVREGVLIAATSEDTRALGKLVVEAAATGVGAGTSPGGALTLSRPSMSTPLPVLVTPLRGQWMLPAERRAAAAVFVTDPNRCATVAGRQLVELFGLTPAEAQLAVALLAGKRLARIAADRGVQVPTVRNQLRAVLAKTGTGRQAELVRLLATLPAVPPSAPRAPCSERERDCRSAID